jgi:hypothetical protein
MTKSACVSYAAPVVIAAASNKILPKEEIGGAKNGAKTLGCTFEIEDVASAREVIIRLLDTLPVYNGEVETMDDFNRCKT